MYLNAILITVNIANKRVYTYAYIDISILIYKYEYTYILLKIIIHSVKRSK